MLAIHLYLKGQISLHVAIVKYVIPSVLWYLVGYVTSVRLYVDYLEVYILLLLATFSIHYLVDKSRLTQREKLVKTEEVTKDTHKVETTQKTGIRPLKEEDLYRLEKESMQKHIRKLKTEDLTGAYNEPSITSVESEDNLEDEESASM